MPNTSIDKASRVKKIGFKQNVFVLSISIFAKDVSIFADQVHLICRNDNTSEQDI
jgi:hypothetical protein